ncbi:MAG: DAK2 domain-containing protein [Ruminococcus sp.]|nr:DAK2 domain-containing protein [Ruminococcus sp.]
MINGNIFRDAIISGANNICLQKQEINDLNIFPVPDGDTGTNMSMTISAAAREIKNMKDVDISQVAAKAASAMLRNARGNSGVITSIIFRGFAKGLAGKQEATGKDLTNALGIGVEDAYKAVTKPTEGTILTVARMAYEEGVHTLESDLDEIYVWSKVVEAASEALELTPKFLPVLKKAGVVDAGGKGLLEIFKGMQSVFASGEIIKFEEEKDEAEVTTDNFGSAVAQYDEVINFTYCTEFIVGRNSEVTKTPDELREFLVTIGDCVVVVDDEEIIKVHVHTDNPGVALQNGLEYGQLLTVKVENMREQHKAAGGSEHSEPKINVAEPVEEIGFVAVAAGEGLKDLFKDMGCNYVVSGGQSMNPSTDDILEAILATPAKNVIVLPNNKNIVMAAEQAVDMVNDRNVYVIKTRTVAQGLTALINYEDGSSVEENIEIMTESTKNVVTGQVTFAARDSEFGGKKIKEGEIIGLEDGRLSICEKTSQKALLKLCKNIIKKNASFVTLIYGEDITEEEAKAVHEIIQAKYDNVDITLVKGDQPVYYYIVGVEY